MTNLQSILNYVRALPVLIVVPYSVFVRLLHSEQQLERNPSLLDRGEERPRAHAVVQRVLHELTLDEGGAIIELEEKREKTVFF